MRNPIKNQFERASLSIVLNLAEGASKPTIKDRQKFYNISLASLRECQAIFDIIGHIVLKEEYDILGEHIWILIQNPENPLPVS